MIQSEFELSFQCARIHARFYTQIACPLQQSFSALSRNAFPPKQEFLQLPCAWFSGGTTYETRTELLQRIRRTNSSASSTMGPTGSEVIDWGSSSQVRQ
jgi:hypothetical protein